MELFGATLDILGKILIGVTVLRVHLRVLHEHQIDEKVFLEMKLEQKLGILGIVLMAAGYGVKLWMYLG